MGAHEDLEHEEMKMGDIPSYFLGAFIWVIILYWAIELVEKAVFLAIDHETQLTIVIGIVLMAELVRLIRYCKDRIDPISSLIPHDKERRKHD